MREKEKLWEFVWEMAQIEREGEKENPAVSIGFSSIVKHIQSIIPYFIG